MSVQPDESRVRVLIVDDDDYELNRFRKMLDYIDPGRYEVGIATDYEQAMSAPVGGYDVCVVDYDLGSRSGLQLIQDRTETDQTTPMVLVTGRVDRELDIAAIAAGAADYVHKDDLTPALLDRTLRYAIERQRVRAELTRLALYDQLTGLPNRTLFRDRLKDGIARSQRNGDALALLFLDLDGFKNVNDTLGHDAGDQLLIDVGQRLRAAIRAVDAVSRLGGDEFTIILEGMARSDDAAIVAKRILDDIARPYTIAGETVLIRASIGAATCPDDATDAELLVCRADAAMYRAKASGGGCQFFSEEMTLAAAAKARLHAALRVALAEEEFVLHYQPQLDVRSGEVIGVEALLRWQRDDKLVPPMEFIGALEETGLIVEVGEWVLRKACSDVSAWRASGLDDCRVSVNVSPRQFRSSCLPETIKSVLEETGLPGDALEIELTEGLIMADTDESIIALAALKECGVRVSIDDFGTGYSSLAYLKRFPVDVLKVDRSFIKDIPDTDDGSIAACVIGLGHTLGLTVIAEGVETIEQLRFLDGTGCQGYQGYYFSKPLPAPQCTALLRAHAERA